MPSTDTRAALEERAYGIAFWIATEARVMEAMGQSSMPIMDEGAKRITALARSAPEERGEGKPVAWLREWRSESAGWQPDSARLYPPPPPSSLNIRDVPLHRAAPPAPAQEPDEGSDALTAAYFMGAADARRASLDALGGEVRPDAEAEAAFAAARAERTRVVDAARRRSAPPVAQGAETSREEREDPTGHAPDCEWHVQRETWICHPSCDLHPAYRGVAQGAEPSLDDELHDLHDRLRDEGRDADADLIDRVGWAMEAADAERAQGAEEERLLGRAVVDFDKRRATYVTHGLPREEERGRIAKIIAEECLLSLPDEWAMVLRATDRICARPVAGSEERERIAQMFEAYTENVAGVFRRAVETATAKIRDEEVDAVRTLESALALEVEAVNELEADIRAALRGEREG